MARSCTTAGLQVERRRGGTVVPVYFLAGWWGKGLAVSHVEKMLAVSPKLVAPEARGEGPPGSRGDLCAIIARSQGWEGLASGKDERKRSESVPITSGSG